MRVAAHIQVFPRRRQDKCANAELAYKACPRFREWPVKMLRHPLHSVLRAELNADYLINLAGKLLNKMRKASFTSTMSMK